METILLVVAVCVLVALALAMARQKARENVRYDSFSSYDAATGGYRAFYEMLAREGIPVERFERHPAFLDASLGTLIWSEPLPFDRAAGAVNPTDTHALEQWVRSGGTLLYIGHDDMAARLHILGLPMSRARSRRPHGAIVDKVLRDAGIRHVSSDAGLRWQLPQRGTHIFYDDGRGPIVVAYRFGRGRVIALIDEALFTNAGIAKADRARLAFVLATQAGRARPLAFDEAVHGYLIPERWWSIVPRPFLVALAIATLALIVAFAGAALRMGPPIVPRARDDASTADFLDALAALLERGHAGHASLAEAAASTSRLIARAFALEEDALSETILARIESKAQRADYVEMMKLAREARTNDKNFVHGVAVALRLRKEFAAHGRH